MPFCSSSCWAKETWVKNSASITPERKNRATASIERFLLGVSCIFRLRMTVFLLSSGCEKDRTGVGAVDRHMAERAGLVFGGLVVEAGCGRGSDTGIQRVTANAE